MSVVINNFLETVQRGRAGKERERRKYNSNYYRNLTILSQSAFLPLACSQIPSGIHSHMKYIAIIQEDLNSQGTTPIPASRE